MLWCAVLCPFRNERHILSPDRSATQIIFGPQFSVFLLKCPTGRKQHPYLCGFPAAPTCCKDVPQGYKASAPNSEQASSLHQVNIFSSQMLALKLLPSKKSAQVVIPSQNLLPKEKYLKQMPRRKGFVEMRRDRVFTKNRNTNNI